jgi:ligand-binding sensor domain-containing protein
MKQIFFFFGLISLSFAVGAQNIPINHWRSHLPYKDGIHVTEVGNKIYCGTTTGLFYWDKSDNSIHPLSKVDGFSDVFIKTMAYDPAHDILFIAYQDGNMDFLQHGKIINYTEFLNNNITINSIYIGASKAYISVAPSTNTDDAVYEMSLDSKFDITDSYNNNNPKGVNRVTVLGSYIYACSESGVKRVKINAAFKRDPNNWENLQAESSNQVVSWSGKVFACFTKGYLRYYDTLSGKWTDLHHVAGDKPIQSLEAGNGKLIMATDDSIYEYAPDLSLYAGASSQQNHVIMDKDGLLWLAKKNFAMIMLDQQWHPGYIQPGDRPSTTEGYKAYGYHNEVWVSTAVIGTHGAPGYTYNGFYMFDGDKWHNYDPGTVRQQYMGMAKDSITNHLWLSSLDSSIIDFDPGTLAVSVYNPANTGVAIPHGAIVTDVGFDKQDNLWAGFYRAPKQLAKRRRDGSWVSIAPLSQFQITSLLLDDSSDVWMVDNWDNKLAIYSPSRNTYATLTSTVGSGGLPSDKVNCVAKDKSGQIWMGTNYGVCVYSDPSLLWGSRRYDVQKPYVNDPSAPGYLLAAQNITAVAVDGANRKWFGTSQGVFLFSADGTQKLLQFNTANSPLVSNQINAIAINGQSGEVFFVTDKGIVSYRGSATEGGEHNENVYAYPNPVKPGYHGPIAIKGLVNDANVKITDVTGQLVYETTALGGQAIWNGRNFSGREANSGVYLVFVTNTDGTETIITKIMIVR